MRWIIGVDLGQANDYTAVCGVERAAIQPRKFELRHLDRWRGETYPKTVERIAALVKRPELNGCAVVMDQTGVGRAVLDMLRDALPGSEIWGVTITAGTVANMSGFRMVNVPKKDLVAMTQVLMQSGRLKIARELPMVETLVQELINFKVKITTSAHESFLGDWREGQHDDMVLALCMACWFGKNNIDSTEIDLFCSDEETAKAAEECEAARNKSASSDADGRLVTFSIPGCGSMKVEFPD
jgi:hypothetical protein